MPASGILDRALSTSFIALLPKEEQDIVRAKVIDIIAREPLLADRESVHFPYVTELHLFKKRA
jgi:hypothetical protein